MADEQLRNLEEILDGAAPSVAPGSPPRGRRNSRSGSVDEATDNVEAFISTGTESSTLHGWSPAESAAAATSAEEKLKREGESLSLPPPHPGIPQAIKQENGKQGQTSARSTATGTSTENTIDDVGAQLGDVSLQKKNSKKKGKEEKQQQQHPKYQPKPKLTKAERRALQEKQRAAKAAKRAASGIKSNGKGGGKGASGGKKTSGSEQSGGKSKKASGSSQRWNSKEVNIFAHLQRFQNVSSSSLGVGFSSSENVHPAIVAVGLQYAKGKLCGANARCIAMLEAIKRVITDYQTPPGVFLAADLDKKLKVMIGFVVKCRPLAVSMGNAFRFVRKLVAHVKPDVPDEQAKLRLCERIDRFTQERITMASEAIVKSALEKVIDDDVILTFGRSFVVEQLLLRAHAAGRHFRVIIVDARPKLEGRQLLNALSEAGLSCSYVLLNAASYVMNEVSKVFVGAAAMMANGTAFSRAGTASIAMMAHAYRKPVIFCCETYKFSERVQLDSIIFNEVGDPEAIANVNGSKKEGDAILKKWETQDNLRILNLSYDVTPQKFITVIITELGMIPCTSVPVIIREFRSSQDFEL
eukprot:g5217.t1